MVVVGVVEVGVVGEEVEDGIEQYTLDSETYIGREMGPLEVGPGKFERPRSQLESEGAAGLGPSS